MDNEQAMKRPVDPVGAVLYAAGFGVVLPVLLAVWSWKVSSMVPLPRVWSPAWGGVLAVGGTVLAGFGMSSLVRFGKGLPMNLYPPPRFVTAGAYRIVAHPIYLGFSLACAGFSIAFGSPGGLWMVTPVVSLGCAALVLGYESHDLRERFGAPTTRPWLSLPGVGTDAPLLRERISVVCLVLLPWAVLYEAFVALGVSPGSPSVLFPFETGIPVIEWTEVLYAATYPLVTLAPFIAGSRQDLRDFAIRGLVATGLMVLMFAAIPVVSSPRQFVPESFAGDLLMLERGLDTPGNAFPSYHVVWILLAMDLYARRMPRHRGVWWGVGAAVAVSTVTTGMHAIADVAAGVLVFVFVRNIRAVWEGIRLGAERIANSWREWQWGRVRVINHGIYAGIGSFLAVGIVGTLVGPAHTPATLLVAVAAVITSALWAQIVEGSPSLLRPYGYYGGVLGIIVGAFAAMGLFGTNAWLMLAGYSVAGPWVQSAGRLRCLVQGCCHGRRAAESVGIAYRHPRSRVTRLSELGGLPLHPTPVYSILWNVVIAVLLGRLWFLEVPLSMIGGLYLILTGLGRFVEEAYRGEPQTRSYGGLRFYQWIAALTVAAGAVVTCLPAPPSGGPVSFDATVVGAAGAFGLFTWFALGVDFPRSNRRFARLV